MKKKILCLGMALLLTLTAGAAMAEAAATEITLADSGIVIPAGMQNVKAEGSVLTITGAGSYTVTGSLSNGQIVVDANKEDEIELTLNGVDVACASSAPLAVRKADKVKLVLANATENVFSDENVERDESACIYSTEDLTIKGDGKLIVYANYKNGIVSKDDLKVHGGVLVVTAVNNALKGNDSVTLSDCDVTVISCEDGVKSTKDEDGKGTITIENATLTVTATDDAITAPRFVSVTNSTLSLTTVEEKAEE